MSSHDTETTETGLGTTVIYMSDHYWELGTTVNVNSGQSDIEIKF